MKKIPIYTIQTISCKPSKIGEIEIMKFEDHLINTKNIHFPHRHDFYYLLYITSGGGSHTIDFKTYPIKQNQLFFMSPGQVHEWDIKPNTKGFTLFFNKELFKTNVFKIEEEWSFFHTFFNDCSYVIPKEHQPIIHNLFTLILTENAQFSSQQQQITKALTSALLFKINSILNNTNNILPSSLHFQIRKFELLIDANFNSQHSVLYYANKLNITPNYLNSLCKKTVAKSAKELINMRLLLESKRLLKHSDLSINQISEYLNFKSTSYFIRFFKHNQFQTPFAFKHSKS